MAVVPQQCACSALQLLQRQRPVADPSSAAPAMVPSLSRLPAWVGQSPSRFDLQGLPRQASKAGTDEHGQNAGGFHVANHWARKSLQQWIAFRQRMLDTK